MNIFEAIILGIVQGLTEFLPVSSSGHLVLLQRIFGINEPGLFFDTMLHLGTLTAVFFVLWKDIWELLRNPFQKLTLFLIPFHPLPNTISNYYRLQTGFQTALRFSVVSYIV